MRFFSILTLLPACAPLEQNFPAVFYLSGSGPSSPPKTSTAPFQIDVCSLTWWARNAIMGAMPERVGHICHFWLSRGRYYATLPTRICDKVIAVRCRSICRSQFCSAPTSCNSTTGVMVSLRRHSWSLPSLVFTALSTLLIRVLWLITLFSF